MWFLMGVVKLLLSMLIFFGKYRVPLEGEALWLYFPSVKPKVRTRKVVIKMHDFRCGSLSI
jgi:hypothetical protein